MKSITMLCFYFGKFPEWAPIYFETLKRNSTINFIFYCDSPSEGFEAPNVIFKKTTLQEFLDKAYNKIGLNIYSDDLYKLCDIAPMVGDIHYEDIKSSDYYGFCDLDLFLGDIRSFYTDEILSNYDVFSTHENLLSGHFMLFRNTEYNRLMYKNIGGLKEKLESSFCLGLAEDSLFRTYKKVENNQKGFKYSILSFLGLKKKTRFYLKEQFTTPFTDIPWLDGSIRNDQPNESIDPLESTSVDR